MVIVKVLAVVVFPAAERKVVVNAVLLGGFAGGVNHTEGKAHDKWSQLHPVSHCCQMERRQTEDEKGLVLVWKHFKTQQPSVVDYLFNYYLCHTAPTKERYCTKAKKHLIRFNFICSNIVIPYLLFFITKQTVDYFISNN